MHVSDVLFLVVLSLLWGGGGVAAAYSVAIVEKASPALSFGNAQGAGHSPCKFTFNPAWAGDVLLMRVAECPSSFGGSVDHIIALKGCDRLRGTCPDLTLDALQSGQAAILDLEPAAQDPRVFFDKQDGWFYLGYFANGEGQQTVYLRRSKTPANSSSWEPVWEKPKPWHRNFCAFQDSAGERFVLFGESPPLYVK